MNYQIKTREAPRVRVAYNAIDPVVRTAFLVCWVAALAAFMVGMTSGARWPWPFGLTMFALGNEIEARAWRALAGNLAGAVFVSMEIYPRGSVRVLKVDAEGGIESGVGRVSERG